MQKILTSKTLTTENNILNTGGAVSNTASTYLYEHDIVRLKKLLAWLNVSRSFIYKQIKSGNFPAPIKLGQRAVAWRVQDVGNWIESRQLCQGDHHE